MAWLIIYFALLVAARQTELKLIIEWNIQRTSFSYAALATLQDANDKIT